MLGNFYQTTWRHIYSHSSENVLPQATKHNDVVSVIMNRGIKSNSQSRLAKKMDTICVVPKRSQKLRAV